MSYLSKNAASNMSGMIQNHVGWPLIICGNIIIARVAYSTKSRFFEITPRDDGAGIPLFSPSASNVINALIEAPKWPLVYGTVLILTGIIVLFAGHEISLMRKLIGALISELGFAFFIAFVIGITIEIKAHAERDKQISRGIISYIYGVNLDNEMFLSTEEYVFKTPFYREDLEISYDFIRRSKDVFLVKYTISYIVKNVGRGVSKYPIHTFVEKPASGEHSKAFPDVKLGLQKIIVDGEEIDAAEIEKAREAVHDSDEYIQSSYGVDVAPGASRRIMGIHLTEKFERDAELWRSVNPCSGISLVISWDESFNLKMKASAVHPAYNTQNHKKRTRLSGFDSKSCDSNSLRASLFKPFFPFNGVYFWWDAERDDVAAGSGGPGGDVEVSGAGEPSPMAAAPEVGEPAVHSAELPKHEHDSEASPEKPVGVEPKK